MQKVIGPFDKPLSRGKTDISQSAFAFLFSELIQYSYTKANTSSEFHARLQSLGYRVGARAFELCCFRRDSSRREVKVLKMLRFVSSNVWKLLFGKEADHIEKVVDKPEYMICDDCALTNLFISLPRDKGSLNCCTFIAGIVQACFDGSGLESQVSAYTLAPEQEQQPQSTQSQTAIQQNKTIVHIKFTPEVIERDAKI